VSDQGGGCTLTCFPLNFAAPTSNNSWLICSSNVSLQYFVRQSSCISIADRKFGSWSIELALVQLEIKIIVHFAGTSNVGLVGPEIYSTIVSLQLRLSIGHKFSEPFANLHSRIIPLSFARPTSEHHLAPSSGCYLTRYLYSHLIQFFSGLLPAARSSALRHKPVSFGNRNHNTQLYHASATSFYQLLLLLQLYNLTIQYLLQNVFETWVRSWDIPGPGSETRKP
jgi:hypothetical protein